LRYYIVSYTSHEKDLNFSWSILKEKVNNELIGTFGNFIYRVLHFSWKNFEEVRMKVDDSILEKIGEVKENIEKFINIWEFKEVCDAFMELAKFGNEYFQSNKPWELIKENRDECERVLANAIQLVKALIIFAYPVMPRSMENIARFINFDIRNAKIDDALNVEEVVKLKKPEVPFKKIEDEKIREMEEVLMKRIEGELIDINEFNRLDIRIGKILKAERIKGSKKLIRLEVDVGEVRQIVAGISETYKPEELVGKLVPVLVNIKPAKILGVESRGMILAVDVGGKAVLLHPDRDVPVGSKVK